MSKYMNMLFYVLLILEGSIRAQDSGAARLRAAINRRENSALVIELLHAEVDSETKCQGDTGLLWAAHHGYDDALDAVLTCNADVDACSSSG